MIYGIVIAITLVLFVFLYLQNNIIDMTKYDFETTKINDDIKIVQLSDLHSKPFKKVINKVKKESPDVIVITGDFINDKGKNKLKMIDFGKELLKVAPVYYITGNHERRLDYFDNLMLELSQIGFTVLLNQVDTFNIKNSQICFLGLDENQASFENYKQRKNGTFKYKDMNKYFEELDNKNGYKIVLSHYPENFMEVKENNFSQYNFDLQLSGHAHGGQFILPFIGPVFSPGQGIFPKYAKGSFGKNPTLIVSRGLGNSEFPFRLFNHPEINVINLHSKF